MATIFVCKKSVRCICHFDMIYLTLTLTSLSYRSLKMLSFCMLLVKLLFSCSNTFNIKSMVSKAGEKFQCVHSCFCFRSLKYVCSKFMFWINTSYMLFFFMIHPSIQLCKNENWVSDFFYQPDSQFLYGHYFEFFVNVILKAGVYFVFILNAIPCLPISSIEIVDIVVSRSLIRIKHFTLP